MKKIISLLICVIMLIAAVPSAALSASSGIDLPVDFINPYVDVKDGTWYTYGVLWCYANDIMTGISPNVFGVGKPVNRATFVTVLSKIDGADLSRYDGTVEDLPFTDVKAEKYYTRPLQWAYENGYTSGVSATRFGTNDTVSREQLATFLRTYALSKGCILADGADVSAYTDADKVSGWARESIEWAVASGMITGTGSNTLSPKQSASREQIALIVKNFVENVLTAEKAKLTFDGTTAFVNDASDVVCVSYVKGDAYNEAEFRSAFAAEAAADAEAEHYVTNDNFESELTISGLYGSNTLFVEYKNGETELVSHFFDPGTEYPVGAVTLGGADISEFTVIYGVAPKVEGLYAKDLADEFAADIKALTGVGLTVASDSDVPAVEGAKEILIGHTNREEAGYVTVDRSELKYNTLHIEMQGNYLILTGNDTCGGTHMAVYEFLRSVAGYTYYGNDTVRLEPAEKVEFADGETIHLVPAMEFNCNYQMDGWNIRIGNPSEVGLHFSNLVHTLPEFGAPDWEDTWPCHLKYFMSSDPCLSDPTIIRRICQNVTTKAGNAIKGGNEEPLIWLTLTDGAARGCQCEACSKIYGTFGYHSTYSFICSYVADYVAQYYPTAKIVGLAYKYTITAPKTDVSDEAYAAFVKDYTAICEKNGWDTDYIPKQDPKAPANAIMCVATDNSCFSHAIDDPDCKNKTNSNVAFNSNFERYCEIFDTIYVWDYFEGSMFKHTAFPNILEMWLNYDYFYRHNVTGMYGLGHTSNCADFVQLHTYACAILSLEKMTREEYFMKINKFLETFYGEGWRYVREYIDMLEELSEENEWNNWQMSKWENIIKEEQYRENLDAMFALWENALAAAKNDLQRTRINANFSTVKYSELRLAYLDYTNSKSDEDLAAFAKINREYKALLEECELEVPSNWTEEGNPSFWEFED